jgi:hypothetical protein
MNMALLNTAAGMMAGDSPYFFSNVGRGAQEGVKSLAASNQQRQADKRLLLQQKVEAEKAADARKAQRSLGVERNLTDLYNREEQAATARLGYDAQIKAAEISRIVPPNELERHVSTIAKLEAQDRDGKLGLVSKYKDQVKDFYANKTVSDDNAATKTYIDAFKSTMDVLGMDPKWQELNRKNPTEARRVAEEMAEKQARNAINFGKTRGAPSGSSTSGKYSDMSNEQFEKLLK